jgi:hypothetical protein
VLFNDALIANAHHHHFYIAKLAKARFFFPKNFENPGESNQAAAAIKA